VLAVTQLRALRVTVGCADVWMCGSREGSPLTDSHAHAMRSLVPNKYPESIKQGTIQRKLLSGILAICVSSLPQMMDSKDVMQAEVCLRE